MYLMLQNVQDFITQAQHRLDNSSKQQQPDYNLRQQVALLTSGHSPQPYPSNHQTTTTPRQPSSNTRQPPPWKQTNKTPPPWIQKRLDTESSVEESTELDVANTAEKSTEQTATTDLGSLKQRGDTVDTENTVELDTKVPQNNASLSVSDDSCMDKENVTEDSVKSEDLMEKKKALQEAKVAKLESYLGQSPVPQIPNFDSPVPLTVRRGFKPPARSAGGTPRIEEMGRGRRRGGRRSIVRGRGKGDVENRSEERHENPRCENVNLNECEGSKCETGDYLETNVKESESMDKSKCEMNIGMTVHDSKCDTTAEDLKHESKSRSETDSEVEQNLGKITELAQTELKCESSNKKCKPSVEKCEASYDTEASEANDTEGCTESVHDKENSVRTDMEDNEDCQLVENDDNSQSSMSKSRKRKFTHGHQRVNKRRSLRLSKK